LADEGRIKENREDFLKSTKPPEGLPKRITKAVKLLYASLIVSAIAAIYGYFIVGFVTGYETVVENGETFTVEHTVTYWGFFPILILIGFYAIYYLFIQQIGLGKNWARITMLVLFLISALFTIIGLPSNLLAHPLSGVLSVVFLIVSSIAYVLLFTGESARWFSSKKHESDLLDD
jgi:magnesium-transporting ATPase (P-type)